MNEDTIAGKLKVTGGKIKESAGETFNDQKLANSGAADQIKGNVQETWGKTKDAVHDAGSTAKAHTDSTTVEGQGTAHSIRDSITSAAEHTKDYISRGIDELRHGMHKDDDNISQVH